MTHQETIQKLRQAKSAGLLRMDGPHIVCGAHPPSREQRAYRIVVMNTAEKMELIAKKAELEHIFRPYYDGDFFLYNQTKWCIAFCGTEHLSLQKYIWEHSFPGEPFRCFKRNPFPSAEKRFLIFPMQYDKDFQAMPLAFVPANAVIGANLFCIPDGSDLDYCAVASRMYLVWRRATADQTADGRLHCPCTLDMPSLSPPWPHLHAGPEDMEKAHALAESLIFQTRAMRRRLAPYRYPLSSVPFYEGLIHDVMWDTLEKLDRFIDRLYAKEWPEQAAHFVPLEEHRLDFLLCVCQHLLDEKAEEKAERAHRSAAIATAHPSLSPPQATVLLHLLAADRTMTAAELRERLPGRDNLCSLLERLTQSGHVLQRVRNAVSVYRGVSSLPGFLTQWVLAYLPENREKKLRVLRELTESDWDSPPMARHPLTFRDFNTLRVLWQAQRAMTRAEVQAGGGSQAHLSSRLLPFGYVKKDKKRGRQNTYLPTLSEVAFSLWAVREILFRFGKKTRLAVLENARLCVLTDKNTP